MATEDMHPQTVAEKYCGEHELILMKNAVGHFVCPFCESNVEL